jgi:hypothetical protein
MFEVMIQIPVVDNNGEVFTADHHAAFEAFVLAAFGGFSWGATVEGAWRNNAGVDFRDTTRTLVVAVSGIAAGAKVAEVAAFAKTHYRQEAIYIRYLGLAEII